MVLVGAPVAQSAQGPSCAPALLGISALEDGVVTVSPEPGSRDALAQTQISFLGVPASDVRVISVRGTRTGLHRGRLLAYSQGDGASFLPLKRFAEGERVTVRARIRVGASARALLDSFTIARADRRIDSALTPSKPGGGAQVESFRSRPDLRPPIVTVTAQSSASAPGDVFIAPYGRPGQTGPMILEPNGGLLWFKPLPAHISAANLRVQEYDGKPVLTWWQGRIREIGFGQGEDVIADSTYTEVAHVHAGNGLQADLHEFQLTPQGTALITAYHPILCNMSETGGLAHGAVEDGVVQEIDVRTGLVMYEWTSIDHVAISDSYEPSLPVTTMLSAPLDYFHINSISLDRDGSLLVSSRNTWTVYKLNARSGRIEWRLGGKHSSFKMGPGTGTAWQHDSRELPNGSISIFDNGAAPRTHSESRAIVIKLNEASHTATLEVRLTHAPPLVAESQGSMQALSNGDWFVGWGGEPYFSEFDSEGRLLFDAHLPVHDQSYRAFRFEWTATPAQLPTYAFQPAAAGGGTLYASWNGATQVSSWRVLAGATPSSLSAVAQAPRSGFETAISLPSGTVGPDLAVEALSEAGAALGTSAVHAPAGLG
jgi:hypothetical protein